MPASVWILNLVVLGAVLEADLGRRKISRFQVLRPLLTAILVCPLFLDSVPTNGHNVALQAVGIGVGALLGGRPPVRLGRLWPGEGQERHTRPGGQPDRGSATPRSGR
jgi:hypothetical protein